ncbi:unnamed protein product [Spirodela intermedia]|uniref:Uncharacterized protein n=1 Tax=Spirodela intermedia TaxID=51605 RepID=A0A7I8K2Q7_SPIIN|nr:unnamed protein product [Spirodela intermedia]
MEKYKAAWNHLALMYSNNISYIYDMTIEYYGLKQDDTYLSQDFDEIFLSGLHLEYKSICNQVLARTELPTLLKPINVSPSLLSHNTLKTTPLVEHTTLVSTQQPSCGHTNSDYSRDGGDSMHMGLSILLVVYVKDIIITMNDYIGISHLNTFL